MTNVWTIGPIVWIGLAAVVVAGILFARSVRRARRSGDPSPVISITLVIGAVWAAVSVIGSLIAVLNTLLSPTVTMTVPVAGFWPELPAGVVFGGTTATRLSGGFTDATLVIADLSTGARMLWATSQGLAILVPGAIAALIAAACFQLLAGRVFAPVLARLAMITAIVVAIGGSAAQVLGDVAGGMASSELFAYTTGGWPEIAGVEDPLRAWLPRAAAMVNVPFWPLAAGLGFAALATIFRYGSRLQRDTDGLV